MAGFRLAFWCSNRSFCHVAGGRTSDAIVDAALSALRSLVKDRLSGRSGGYSSGRQVLGETWLCFELEAVQGRRLGLCPLFWVFPRTGAPQRLHSLGKLCQCLTTHTVETFFHTHKWTSWMDCSSSACLQCSSLSPYQTDTFISSWRRILGETVSEALGSEERDHPLLCPYPPNWAALRGSCQVGQHGFSVVKLTTSEWPFCVLGVLGNAFQEDLLLPYEGLRWCWSLLGIGATVSWSKSKPVFCFFVFFLLVLKFGNVLL